VVGTFNGVRVHAKSVGKGAEIASGLGVPTLLGASGAAHRSIRLVGSDSVRKEERNRLIKERGTSQGKAGTERDPITTGS
jgi:hypothetical protein